ncbi:S-adenosylhomocysteine hydrolase [Cuniculiplasma divulgatum]|jgi:adenosylhomocysteinase|uniref:Adenosylhomocysteinase n=2 Tax=Cuniculiplasma divulgatum TaxID=1673428 RepID=A0A1N5SY94_9ARCH|nr:S-adenosylhomocysteine hydrolase [Cuniculiplasma divulgatum]SJK84253.1 S-adenosylhomocysteine hydrolase [Cuniculiplasma divulgatum]
MEMKSNGYMRLDWARTHMPVVNSIRDRMIREKPFKGVRIGMALHVEAKTGILALLMQEGGADVTMSSCNPLSTDDAVVKSLKEDYGMKVFARKGETEEEYYEYLNKVIDSRPQIVVDDGGDLVKLLHTSRSEMREGVIGGNEETTTGVNRLRNMEKKGDLKFPMFDVNDASMKHLFDNRYGTGQSALDGIMNATNILIAGKRVSVVGFGYCGKGVALRMKGMGARVTVTEVDPVKANEATMEGYDVMPIKEALKVSDMVVTVTGVKSVVDFEALSNAKDGIILSNAGHFNNEIDLDKLETMSKESEQVRDYVKGYTLQNGKKIYVIADGRLVNLAAGQGHPVEIMDMSFAIQALTAEHLLKNHKSLENKVYPVPYEVDQDVARIRLESIGIKIDQPTEEQIRYSESWEEGT